MADFDHTCSIDGCGEPATQMHGIPPHLVYTCDKHADEVMMALINVFIPEAESHA